MNLKITDIQEEKKINNSIQSLLLGQFQGGMGFQTREINSLATIFSNLRWYLTSWYRNQLSQAYAEIGLVSAIVDIPVDDALRGGPRIKTKQLDEDEIDKLLGEIERHGDITTLGQTGKWNRLYGGAGTIINTGDNAEEPLDISKLKQGDPLGFISADMWELNGEADDRESMNVQLDQIKSSHFYFHGVKIHRSRIMLMKGIEAPSLIRPRLRGFGLSVCERMIQSINQYLKTNNLTFEVLDEFKLDIFKIKDLNAATLNPDAERAMQKRLETANMQKNYQNALTMDKEDDYDHKQLSFAGIAEVMNGIRIQVASDLRIPLSKLFGTGSSGFSSGQDDIENYNSMVDSEVRQKMKFDMLKIVELRCQVLFGFVPDDLRVDFYPLRVLTAEQEESVKNSKLSRLIQMRDKGMISPLQFKEAVNKGNLCDIQIDVDDEVLETLGDDTGESATPKTSPGSKAKEPKEPKEPK